MDLHITYNFFAICFLFLRFFFHSYARHLLWHPMLAQLVTSKEFPSLLCSYQDQKQKVQWQLAKKKKKKKVGEEARYVETLQLLPLPQYSLEENKERRYK